MLSKDEILNQTNRGLDVFKHYISFPFKVGRNFFNPLYEDNKASCNIYLDRNSNIYRIKDFGNDDFSGDCFSFVAKLKGLNCNHSQSFIEILECISSDLHLSTTNIPTSKVIKEPTYQAPTLEKEVKLYKFGQKSFTETELAYWAEFGITQKILSNYRVVSLLRYESENSNNESFALNSSNDEPLFGYLGKRYLKLYRPFSKIRFLYGGDFGDKYCFGLEQLPTKGDTLFITGGEKDVMTLASQGFNAICFNSETSNISKNMIRKLSYRFKHIVILYDVDKTGLESSAKHVQQLAEFGVKRLLLPLQGTKDEKDISDYFKLGYTRNDFLKIFLELLDTLYSETMAILKSCEIDFNNPPISAEVLISINDVPLGTEGNLLCITGGEGTGKSNYVGSIIAGAIKDEKSKVDTLGTDIQSNTKNKAVLLYDTEQSEVQLYKNTTNILKRSKEEDIPHNFKVYCLTGMSRKERLQAIIQSMDKFYYEFGGIQMVVIDGIADLIQSANDEIESIKIVDELYRLAGIYQTCIICVLHFIPSGLKLRGHLGSELQRKAAAILSIEKDTDPSVSVIKALKVRDGSPLDVPLVQFTWNKELGMHSYVGEKPKEEKEKRKENELIMVAKNIFNTQKHWIYIDLCEQIQNLLDVKERTAKSYIKFMREKDIILKDPSNSSYYIIGHI